VPDESHPANPSSTRRLSAVPPFHLHVSGRARTTGRPADANIVVLATYVPHRQHSMLGYAELLLRALREVDQFRVEKFHPPVILGQLAGVPGLPPRALFALDRLIGARWHIPHKPADVLHIVDQAYAWCSALSPARIKVVTCHDVIPFLAEAGELHGWSPTPLFRRRLKRISRGLAEADQVICTSEATRRDLLRLLGIGGDRVTVIHNCLRGHLPISTREQRLAHLRACGLDEEAQPILLLGGNFYKNRLAGIRAFAAAASRLSPHAVLCLVSEPGEMLETHARSLGIGDRVRFLPDVSDERLSALMVHAKVLLCPSLYEGFGWPVIEAQALGIPVICSDAGALAEVAGDAALIAAPSDHETIASYLVDLMGNPELADTVRQRGLANVQRFGFQEWARKHAALYHHLLAA
jgi:glycosyltransferase involved in cell wall biosynthesis